MNAKLKIGVMIAVGFLNNFLKEFSKECDVQMERNRPILVQQFHSTSMKCSKFCEMNIFYVEKVLRVLCW